MRERPPKERTQAKEWTKGLHILAAAALCLFTMFIFAQPIILSRADLGRHIKSGQIFFEEHRPLSTIRYSYVETDRPIVNHHWGAGVLYYLVWRRTGFAGLSVLNIMLLLATTMLFYRCALQRSTPGVALFVTTTSVLLQNTRAEIRPETLSYLALAIFYTLLSRHRDTLIPYLKIAALFIVQVLWVNSHIYFFLGPLLILAFMCEQALQGRQAALRRTSLALLTVLIACACNPYGLHGALAPFTTPPSLSFVLETLSLPTLLISQPGFRPLGLIFLSYLVTLLLLMAMQLRRQDLRRDSASTLIVAGLFVLSILTVRSIHFLLWVAIPSVSAWLSSLLNKDRGLDKTLGIAALTLITTALLSFLLPGSGRGIGLRAHIEDGGTFCQSTRIQDPLFNNFCSAGYAIFYLYPHHKLFISNTPEFYSPGIMSSYIKTISTAPYWQEALARYGFRTIFWSKMTTSDAEKRFLEQRKKDTHWKILFEDEDIAVLSYQDISSH